MTTRSAAIRTVAAALVFDGTPPYIRTMNRAREAAGGIVDALCDNGMMAVEGALPATERRTELAAVNGSADAGQGEFPL